MEREWFKYRHKQEIRTKFEARVSFASILLESVAGDMSQTRE
jgi:hypothetical protein